VRCPARWAGALSAILILFGIFPCQAFAISTSATSAILVDVDSGRVLYEQNADARMRIASTTKIMTALVAIEHGGLSDTVTVGRDATLAEGSSLYLQAGEKRTLEELLYGLLLSSGNDAAVAIADHVGGSTERFVRLMNEKAAELGMSGTSFANPNGLDSDRHYSTARDMAKLACAAVNNETLLRIASTRQVTTGGRTMTNHNKLLTLLPGCIGLKTGYTRAAGRTLVSCTVRGGQRLAAVTLQDGNDWADHAALCDYGFSAYPARRAVAIGQQVGNPSGEGRPGGPGAAAGGGELLLAAGPGRDADHPAGAAGGAGGPCRGRKPGGTGDHSGGWKRGGAGGAPVRRRGPAPAAGCHKSVPPPGGGLREKERAAWKSAFKS
jgi:D-alanyl-D-alanine carboxypeptidase (penicillin-binding protein 5/6)